MIDMKDRIRQWFGVYVEKGYVNVVSPETLHTDARFSLRIPLTDGDDDRVFRSKSAFRQVFEHIVQQIHARLGEWCDPEFIIALPDSYGLIEQLRISSYAEENGITVTRYVYKSLAAASSIAARDHRRDPYDRTVIISGGCGDVRWFSSLTYGDGVIEKESTAVYKKSHTRSEGYREITSTEDWNYYLSRAEAHYLVETERDELTAQIMSRYRYSGSMAQGKIYSASPSWIGEGLIRHILTLSGRSDELWLSTTSPYNMWIETCSQIIRLMRHNTTIPTMSEESVCKLPYTGAGGTEAFATLFEERFGRMMRIAYADLDTGILEGRGNLNVRMDIDANASVLLAFENPAVNRQERAVIRRYTGQERNPEDSQPHAAETGRLNANTDMPLKDLLPLIDNLEYGYRMSAKKNDPGTEGLEKLLIQALDILKSRGIERIRAEGNSFDYNYHEAVSHVTDPFLPENYVKEVVQSGYTKNGVLIRAAKVIVAN